MSAKERKRLESVLAFHAAPTLMGVKCGSLLSLPVKEYDPCGLKESIVGRRTDVRFISRGESRRLVYIYDRDLLDKTLSAADVRAFIARFGYDPSWSTDRCLDRLCERLTQSDFPHEIGVFLGYPLEDVKGFINNCGQHCKYCGMWKVYGDVESAKAMFECYERCRYRLCRELENGKPLRLCVA